MKVLTIGGRLAPFKGHEPNFQQLRREVESLCPGGSAPLRLAVTQMAGDDWKCEVETAVREGDAPLPEMPSIFDFRRRRSERTHQFNAVMLIPTGIDCAIGGHAGDATPAARLLASLCDHLILHPNVVNASDVNEQTDNSLYVEGSLICRLMMGTIGLQKVRSNRILMITEAREDGSWTVDQAVNSTSAVRATLGAAAENVVVMKHGLSMKMALSPHGRATGEISGYDDLFAVLRRDRRNYDAIAVSTKITPLMDSVELHQAYFRGEGVNPWGGVEAALTHTISAAFDLPSAHAPTMSDLNLRTQGYGQVDPRKSAEAISTSYVFCVLKGLHKAPRVVPHYDGAYDPSRLGVEDVSCLVIPDGAVGLPTLAALVQGVPVIAVRNNTNLMRNDLDRLPWAPGQLHRVENYLEAAGLVAALKAGVHPSTVGRPLAATRVEVFNR